MEEQHFSNKLRYLIMSTKPNIVLDDFNFNYQKYLPIVQLMQCFKFEQLVGQPTHIRGGLIDQVYVSKGFSVFSHLRAQVLSVYYSDHDAIEVTTDKQCKYIYKIIYFQQFIKNYKAIRLCLFQLRVIKAAKN